MSDNENPNTDVDQSGANKGSFDGQTLTGSVDVSLNNTVIKDSAGARSVGPAGAGAPTDGGSGQSQVMQRRRPVYKRPELVSRKGIRITPPTNLLNGSNTDSWKLAVRPYLIFTGVEQYIKHVEEPEPDCPSHPLWAKDELNNVAVLLSLIEPQCQSRFIDCTTARQVWEMAIAESSSLVVRVGGIIRKWSNLDPQTMSPRDFVNQWNAALSFFRQCGNNWNLEHERHTQHHVGT